jgi:hypothetical protein
MAPLLKQKRNMISPGSEQFPQHTASQRFLPSFHTLTSVVSHLFSLQHDYQSIKGKRTAFSLLGKNIFKALNSPGRDSWRDFQGNCQ